MLGVSIVLFVVLLAVLFAVAAVTAGFGDLMRPVFQDARPVGLPETKVTPDDLEALRFNVVLRGYKMTEVDAVLHRMAREIAERDAVLAELRGEHRPVSFRPPAGGAAEPGDDQPTELLAPYSGYAGEPPVAPAWNPDDYRTAALQEPTEALPGYQADDATTLMPAVTDDVRPVESENLADQPDLSDAGAAGDAYLHGHGQGTDEHQHVDDHEQLPVDESRPQSSAESQPEQ